jgi:hypothetical protein
MYCFLNNFGFPMMGKSILLCKSSRIHLYILHAVHMHLHVYKKTLYSGLTSQYIALAFVSTCLEQYWNGKSAGGSTQVWVEGGVNILLYRQFETYRYKFEKESAAIDKKEGVLTQISKKMTEICPFIWPRMTKSCLIIWPKMTESCHFRWPRMSKSRH